MDVIELTWVFKIKHYPDGLGKKLKAHFCARGNVQIKIINFFETYVPAVQLTPVHLMPILAVLWGLKSKQGVVTARFLYADLDCLIDCNMKEKSWN